MPPPPSQRVVDDSFICGCGEEMRRACERVPFYKEHEGKRYCVLHYPGEKDGEAFKNALKWKLDARDFNFHGIWFPDDASFSGFNFTEDVNFAKAHFSKRANFTSATFRGKADFRIAQFADEAAFGYATFQTAADFRVATFGGRAIFSYATFNSDADFTSASFANNASFSRATLKGYFRFASRERTAAFPEGSRLSLQFCNIDKPERVSFHSLTLRPHWFVNVDSRKFDFINVDWSGDIDQELECLKVRRTPSPHRLLGIACRYLALNAEENHRYDQASRFRYWSLDVRRCEHRFGFEPLRLGWWYWLASGYGERVPRAFAVLLSIWLIFALIFYRAECAAWSPPGAPICVTWRQGQGRSEPRGDFPRALAYTLGVMTLQKPEPHPDSPAAQVLVIFATILGPLQGALLALAIRRKFMR